MSRTGLFMSCVVAHFWLFVCLSGSSSGVMSICWGVGGIKECSFIFMSMITLMVRLCTMVATCLLTDCS